jgi:D-alanyl-D-alanine-carboxypeptidase/D-alanyl-D-alanine-endopeptidase
VFCGTVLGALTIDGKVKLTDPLQTHINAAVTIPTMGGRTLRLIDLVGQTSGLPREVARPDSPAENPFATNTREVLFSEIQKGPYLSPPGTSALYSNFGYDLLGVALGDASGKPYADALKERVLDPLGMVDTMFNPPAGVKSRLMQGHDFDGSPLPNVPTSTGIECSGGLHTTGADMLRWIKWNIERTTTVRPDLREFTQAAHVYRDGLRSVFGMDDGGPILARRQVA